MITYNSYPTQLQESNIFENPVFDEKIDISFIVVVHYTKSCKSSTCLAHLNADWKQGQTATYLDQK